VPCQHVTRGKGDIAAQQVHYSDENMVTVYVEKVQKPTAYSIESVFLKLEAVQSNDSSISTRRQSQAQSDSRALTIFTQHILHG
jgi:hypothetical protein